MMLKRYVWVLLLCLVSIGTVAMAQEQLPKAALVVVIDGKLASQEVLEQLPEEAIHTIQFLPPQKAKLIYGAAGANGALLVKTKQLEETLTESRVESQKEPLVVVEGKVMPADSLSKMEFERIDVVRGQQAINMYGPAAKDGVYLVSKEKERLDAWLKVEDKKGRPVKGAELVDEAGTTLAITNNCGLAWLEGVEKGKNIKVLRRRYQPVETRITEKKQIVILQK